MTISQQIAANHKQMAAFRPKWDVAQKLQMTLETQRTAQHVELDAAEKSLPKIEAEIKKVTAEIATLKTDKSKAADLAKAKTKLAGLDDAKKKLQQKIPRIKAEAQTNNAA